MHFSPLFRGLEAKIRIICREEILVHIWMVGKNSDPRELYTPVPLKLTEMMQGSLLSYIYVVLIGQIYWLLLFLTCLEWCLVLLRRWKNLSHLAHKLPQLSQRMIASVSPSS